MKCSTTLYDTITLSCLICAQQTTSKIRKEGNRAMNRDEGSYQLSQAYDRFLDATADPRIKTRKNWVLASSDEDLVMRSKRQNKV